MGRLIAKIKWFSVLQITVLHWLPKEFLLLAMKTIIKDIKCFLYVQFILFVFIGCDNGKSPEKLIKKPLEKDDYYEKCRKLVLTENKIGLDYFFKLPKKEVDEFTITYLGTLKTAKGDTLKFINYIYFFGLYEDSKKANSSVFIYDAQNKRIGLYHLGGALDVPTKIEGSYLIFSYDNENCNQTTAISFLDSIPQKIFINCTKNVGDLYSLTME